MRILQINNYHYRRGGSDCYFFDVSDLLEQAGHEVASFSTTQDFYEGSNRFTNQDLAAGDFPSGAITDNASSFSNISKFLYSLDAKRLIKKAIQVFRPDIIHLHIYYGQLTASILSPIRESGIPVVQTLHEYKLVCPTHGLFAKGKYCDACDGKKYWKALGKRCNRGSLARTALSVTEAYLSDFLGARDLPKQFIAVSHFQKNKLIELGVSPDKLSVLHHFSDSNCSSPIEQGKYFLYVGRIVNGKGLRLLLNAYKKMKSHAYPLKIVGDYGDSRDLLDLTEQLGLSNSVEWVGYKKGDELERLYRNCLCVVNPSRLNETFGLTVLEGLSRGRPVIASNVGAFPEVLSHGEDGLIFESGNVEQLSHAMNLLVDNPDKAYLMGLSGLEKVRRVFSKQKHLQGLLEIYNKYVLAKASSH
jgi:glycosyltransferase involved in cell wall biosynthesis